MTSRWIDHGVTPPQALPDDVDGALAYVAHVFGHVCYERWTFTRLKKVFPSLAEAKAAKPVVFRILIDASEACEWWERGRVQTAPSDQAPSPEVVLERLLQTHRQRFKRSGDALPAPLKDDGVDVWLSAIDAKRTGELAAWLTRGGRFVNPQVERNTLAVTDDLHAMVLFLRECASRSRHTLRAYASELKKLIGWCRDRQLGPLSDLTRNDLLAYRDTLRTARAVTAPGGQQRVKLPAERTQARALAVVASLFQYWHDTGYLIANPASGLTAGGPSRTDFAPNRFLPPAVVAGCDAWVAKMIVGVDEIAVLRRHAIWVLYRYGGVRLAELVWSPESGLPRLEVQDPGQWTLYVLGKGNKPRAVPLPAVCIEPLSTYRRARGLPAEPAAHEHLALIHGFKGGTLQEAGLYNEVKLIFDAVADEMEATDPAQALMIRTASPHWLRHAYAKALVVDHQTPLPVAQMLLGHASVQTTAAYARTDQTQLRQFVEKSFNHSTK